MTFERDEQFRLRTAEALGRIEERGESVLAQMIALNNTVSLQGERIAALESSWKTIKLMTGWIVGSLAAVAAVVIAWFRTS
jgi:hypothetical protein